MSFFTEIENLKQFTINLVVDIDGTKFSAYQIDSGLTIDSDKIGLLFDVSINPSKVDLRDAKTTIATTQFKLLDKDQVISDFVGSDDSSLVGKDVDLYVGLITGSFDWSDYTLISKTQIKSLKRSPNFYSLNATENTDRLIKEIFKTKTTLQVEFTISDTQIFLIDGSDFPNSGAVKINDEFIQYGQKNGNVLELLSRGDLSSTVSDHDTGSDVFIVTNTGQINPIDLILSILVSPGGGSSYDTLNDGLGINQSLIDISTFEAIRDENFQTDEVQFYLYDIGKGIDFLENQLLLANNLRITNKNGLISIALIDQIEFLSDIPILNEDSIIGTPDFSVGGDRIINNIEVKYDFTEGTQTYAREAIFEDTESISSFGKKTLNLEFKGIRAALNGASIVSNRANRLLARLSSPIAEINTTTHMDKININVGDDVNLIHRYLPQQGASLGFDSQLEILSKAIDFRGGIVKYTLQFTSYAGLRIGLIAPSPFVTSITSQSVFDVEDSSNFEVGYVIELWNTTLNAKISDGIRTITDITGNQITVNSVFSTTITTDMRLVFADYDDVTDGQKLEYAFVGEPGGSFSDSKKSYQIIF